VVLSAQYLASGSSVPGDISRKSWRSTAAYAFVNYLSARRLSYSLGFALNDAMASAIEAIPDQAWTPAYDADTGRFVLGHGSPRLPGSLTCWAGLLGCG
jgi:hypothetical protein